MYIITDSANAYLLGKGKPMSDIPKSWKESKIEYVEALASNYNSGLLTIYKVYGNDNITLRYSIYRDGCFYPYCGILTKVNIVPRNTYIPRNVSRDSLYKINNLSFY